MINTSNSIDADKRPSLQRNRLLSSMTPNVQGRLFKHLELVQLAQGKVLCESGGTMRQVYFPSDCTVCQEYLAEDGHSTAISVVGNDGVVGVSFLLGGESTPYRAVVQNSGAAYRLSAQRLKDEFNRHGELMQLMLRYAQSLVTQIGQTVVCNRHHSIDQQLARWLLLSLDRVQDFRLAMTHDLIANTLGVRREGVTKAAGRLQTAGIINYSRGHITVLQRPALEAQSCECYSNVERETDRLLPAAQRHQAG